MVKKNYVPLEAGTFFHFSRNSILFPILPMRQKCCIFVFVGFCFCFCQISSQRKERIQFHFFYSFPPLFPDSVKFSDCKNQTERHKKVLWEVGACTLTDSAVWQTLFSSSDLNSVAKENTFNNNLFYFDNILQSLKYKFSQLNFMCLFSDFVPELRHPTPCPGLLLFYFWCFLIFYLIMEYSLTTSFELKFT